MARRPPLNGEVVWLPVTAIALSERRAHAASKRTVARYAALLAAGREPPPLDVRPFREGRYLLTDGRHRLLAARRAGHRFVPAIVDLSSL